MAKLNPVTKTILICGGGHASLPLIKMGRKWKEYGLKIVLVSADRYLYYSGAIPQFMGGFYTIDEARIDLKELCHKYDTTFYEDTVRSFNDDHKKVSGSKSEYRYDFLVINTGVESREPEVTDERMFPVKPMKELVKLRKEIENGKVKSVLIAGGGAAGCEIALNLSHPKSDFNAKILLMEISDSLLSSFSSAISQKIKLILSRRGVDVVLNNNWQDDPETAKDYDAIILAAGNKPSLSDSDHSFDVDSSGRIITDDTLLISESSCIFAAGDVAHAGSAGYPQIGVHAVKQGVTLRHNVLALATEKPLKPYKPYKLNPLIVSDGPDYGFFITAKKVYSGRWAIILKYILDMNWLEKYTRSPDQRRSLLRLLRDGIKRVNSKRSRNDA